MQCDQEVALSGFLGQVHSNVVEEGLSGEAPGTTLVAVLGGGCVTDSELIADTIAAGERKTPLVSPTGNRILLGGKMCCVVTSFLFGSQISYNPFLYSSTTAIPSGGIFHFQMYPSLRGVVTTLVATIQQYGWKQMSIISEFNYPFLQVHFLYNVLESIACIKHTMQFCIFKCMPHGEKHVVLSIYKQTTARTRN